MSFLRIALVASAMIFSLDSYSYATPVALDVKPIAIYEDVPGTFGLTYDYYNMVLWTSLDDAGDDMIHTMKPYHSFTAGELATMPTVNGIKRINAAAGQFGWVGLTAPTGGAEYRSLAFDSTTNQIIMQGQGPTLVSFDPFSGNNMNNDYAPFSAWEGFSDGLDVTDGNVWHSGDTLDIIKNGSIFGMRFNPAQTVLPGWTGIDDGKPGINGWAGIQQVNNQLWTVGVMTAGDAIGTRTLAGYDANTGDLLWYDPNGDDTAIHFADMAFDGQYIYIADLHGDINGTGPIGDIYVYAVPEPAGIMMLTLGGLLVIKRN